MFDRLFFDLDGTLTDPGLGITNSVWHALNAFGIPVRDRSELYRFVGPPLIPAFMEFYGLSRGDAEKALKIYREYFVDKGIYENELLPGVPETLEALLNAKKRLYLATSKPEALSVRVLEHFGLQGYFEAVFAATMDETRTTKPEVLSYGLSVLHEPDLSTCLMIGDRKHDVEGAHAVGMQCYGVLSGYGSRQELEQAGADAIVDDLPALLPLLL